MLSQSKRRTPYLSVIFTTAVLISVMRIYNTSSPSEAGRDQAPLQPVFGAREHSCRSLFTITSVPDADTLAIAQSLEYSGGNATSNGSLGSDSWTPRHSHIGRVDRDVTGAPAAIRRVRHLLQERSSPRGATTEDYRSLARLLPSFLSSNDTSNHSGKGNNMRTAPTLSAPTRIGANGGVLPYVPCVITPFHDPATVTACFRKRMVDKPLWISFLGDSKIRGLFYKFLMKTDDTYHFMINMQNKTKSFVEVRKKYVKLHTDMEATTRVASRLRVTFSFGIFAETQPSRLKVTKELQQLSRWAAGEEATPQLLIIGYTSWMMQRTMHNYVHDVLGYLGDVHRRVVPLLEQISQRTRVLVLPQSRNRPHAATGRLGNMRVAFSDAAFDWSEMVFLHYQRLYREEGRRRPAHTTPQSSPSLRRLAAWSEEDGEAQRSSPRPDTIRGRQDAKPIRDHLVPSETSDSGLWWWDTSLPLNLAGISECEDLYQRGMDTLPIYKTPHLRCIDSQHAGAATLTDLVTMLLNLMCNSLMGAPTGVCCS
ncbi:uncharacterized protein [Panulirus ornatus]|uniref:uncharacterized protein n=1 Tax=Panulirus ornatus TaxID=150431 RepID=UPI003A8429C1